jgi:bifunctional oligoribonuclease and PAP phosphatase NrnA
LRSAKLNTLITEGNIMGHRNNTIIWNSTAQAVKLLDSPPKKIAFLIHINPDGDALGSALGLSRLLSNGGHECLVISPNDFPGFLRWMPGASEICQLTQSFGRAEEFMKNAELIFVVDCNELKRIIRLQEDYNASPAYKILIDHHPDPELAVDCMLSDTSVSSTAELIYRFMIETGLQKHADQDVATCLLTGIMTDTGCFSYNSSSRRTFETVASLLDYGIDKDEIYNRIYNNYSEKRMHLLGFSLHEKMEVLESYHTAIISLTLDELKSFNFQVGDTEGFVNYPLSIKGICFTVMFVENGDKIRVSLRSKGSFAVNEIARKYYSGGGHANASGGDSYVSMEETISRFKAIIPEYQKELSEYED